METYNYDDSAAMPGYDTETSATPSVPETGNSNDVPAAPGFGPEGPVTPSVPTNPADSNVPATPGFGPLGPVTPSLPSSNSNMGCVNCTGNIIWPNSSTGILWTWGTLSPFFSTTSDIAHVRFYNAAAIREPLDIYLNGRLVVSNLDYMFRGGNSYTLSILGTANSYSVQVMTS